MTGTRRRAAPLVAAAALLLPSCGFSAATAAPSCGSVERLAVVAQSVPAAAYVPCVRPLPAGWRVTAFDVRRGRTELSLLSDRSDGRDVHVLLTPRCDVTGASPAVPRDPGVRTYLRLTSLSPLYAGTRYDVFPGGCVQAEFAFPRGPHIPLVEDLEQALDLVPRRELRLRVRDELGVELDP